MLSLGGGSVPPPPPNGLMSLGGGAAQPPPSPPATSSPLSPPPAGPSDDPQSAAGLETGDADPQPTSDAEHRPEQIQADLPELEPALEGMEAIETKKILLLINNFVITTVEFVNKFGVLCERRLREVSQKTKRVEIQLNILEDKLNSVPWLSDGSSAAASPSSSSPPPAPAAAPAADAAGPATTALPPPPPPGSPPPPQTLAAAEEATQQPPAESAQPSIDPRYQNYLNMVKMGVPPAALQNKINAEGLDFGVFESLVESGVTSVGGGGGGSGGGGGGAGADAGEADGESDESEESETDFD